jgi:hypothetical protein
MTTETILLIALSLTLLLLSAFVLLRYGQDERDTIEINVTRAGNGESHRWHTYEDER